MILEKDFNVISVFDVLAKEKNYNMVKSTPEEVGWRFFVCVFNHILCGGQLI